MMKVIKFGAAGLVGALLLAAQPAHAETEVLESTVPELKVGTKLQDGAYLKLPDGGTVRLLVKSASGNSTKTLKGPYQGTAAAYKQKRNWWHRLTNRDRDTDLPIGGSRASKPMPPEDNPKY